MNKKILIIAAHPDDEILGAGGTLLKHQMAGDEIYCLILGEGLNSRGEASATALKKLQQDSLEAGKIIGFKETFFSNLPDNSFDSVSLLSIIKVVEDYIGQIKPEIIFTHHDNDLNIDHRRTFQAVITACRPGGSDCPKEIYTFETLSSTEWQAKTSRPFAPNTFVDIEEVIDQKIEALKKYTSEIREYPHPRSAEGLRILAQYRGLESGLKLAEAFCLIKKID